MVKVHTWRIVAKLTLVNEYIVLMSWVTVFRDGYGLWIQHFDKSTEIGVPNDRHWLATARDPANNESSQFLTSISGAGSERIHHVLLRLDVFSWAAKPLMFNKVAGGVGACMA